MSREANSVALSSVSSAAAAPADTQHSNDSANTIIEDSNNNTSLIDREPVPEGAPPDGNNSPAIREIHKNSWLKRMPCVDRWSGRFPKVKTCCFLFVRKYSKCLFQNCK